MLLSGFWAGGEAVTGTKLESTVAFFTYSHGIGYLLAALVFVWLASWFGFRWRCRTVLMMLHSGFCAFAVRSAASLASLALGASFLWAMYLSVVFQNFGADGDAQAGSIDSAQIAQAPDAVDWNQTSTTTR